MERNIKNQKGITLVALVITIIVMLILVAVSVTVAINGGLFTKAKEAGNEWEDKSTQEAAGNILKVNVNGTETTMNIDSTINTLKERPKTPGTNPETPGTNPETPGTNPEIPDLEEPGTNPPAQTVTFSMNKAGTVTEYTVAQGTTWAQFLEENPDAAGGGTSLYTWESVQQGGGPSIHLDTPIAAGTYAFSDM